jgi:hypothetical protein
MSSRPALTVLTLALALTVSATAQTRLIGGRSFDGSIDPSQQSGAPLAASCGVLGQCVSPNPSPGGVTWDGTCVWQGNYFGSPVLQRIDPVTCTVVRTIPAPDVYIGGLAWDGTSLWVCDEESAQIYRVDPLNGNVLSTIPAPAFGSGSPNSSDLAWDGHYLWHVEYLPGGLYKLDPANGNIVTTLPAPSQGLSGISYVAGVLVITDYQTDLVYRVDPLTGNVLSSCPSPDSHPWGIEVTASGSTWLAGANTSQLYEVDTGLVSISTYCTAGTSTNGCVPAIGYSGSPSVSASSGFTLTVANVPGQKAGIFFYGINGQVAFPWATGSTSWFCVKSPTQRMSVQASGGTLNSCTGALAEDWLAFVAANPTALGQPFAAGNVVNAQGWYRDPAAPKTTNTTDALEFALVP